MKKFGILFIIAFLSFQMNAQVKSSLTIFSKEGEKFWIVRNGVKQNEKPATSVTIENIVDRSFKIKVLIDDEKLSSVDQTIYTIDVDEKVCNLTYELRLNNKKKYVLRMVSFVPVGETSQTTVTQQTQTTVTQPQQTTTTTQTTQQPNTQTTTTVKTDGFNMTVTDPNGVDLNVNMNVPKNGQVTTTTQTTQNPVVISTTSTSYMPNGSMCQAPSMNQKGYMDFKYNIEAQNMFNRLEFIKATFSKNCMLAEQVAGIIQLNYPTVDELEVAKYGYRYTFDTQNYGVVVKVMKSESKQKELMAFIGSGTTSTSSTTTSVTQQTTTTSSQTTHQQNPNNHHTTHPENPAYNNCRGPMPTADFDDAKAQITKASFADDKMRVAKQITKANCLSVAQIKEICKMFSFEDNKLEYAKFAYDFTFEKNKYYLVNDVFSFSSSREDLDEYIQGKQK